MDNYLPSEFDDQDGIFLPSKNPVIIKNRKCIITKEHRNYG